MRHNLSSNLSRQDEADRSLQQTLNVRFERDVLCWSAVRLHLAAGRLNVLFTFYLCPKQSQTSNHSQQHYQLELVDDTCT